MAIYFVSVIDDIHVGLFMLTTQNFSAYVKYIGNTGSMCLMQFQMIIHGTNSVSNASNEEH